MGQNTPNDEKRPPRHMPEEPNNEMLAQTERLIPPVPQPDSTEQSAPEAEERTVLGTPTNGNGESVQLEGDDERTSLITPAENDEERTRTIQYADSGNDERTIPPPPSEDKENLTSASAGAEDDGEPTDPRTPAVKPPEQVDPTPTVTDGASDDAFREYGVAAMQQGSGSNVDPYQGQPAWAEHSGFSSGQSYPPVPPAQSVSPTPPPPPVYNPYSSQPSVSGANYPTIPNAGSGVNLPPPPNVGSGANYPPPPNASAYNPYASAGQYQRPTPPPKPPKQPGKLARPLPLWAFIGGIVLIVALMVVLHLTGSDWAAGAAHAGALAVVLAFALLIALAVRAWDGMTSTLNATRRRQVLVSLLCVFILFVQAGTELFLQNPLHNAQAHSFEDQQQWQAAIDEYTLAGQRAPDGEDIARVYGSWGLALNKAGNYDEAIKKFAIVITKYTASSLKDEAKRAQDGDIDARFALTQKQIQANDYAGAEKSYTTIMNLPYCDDTCKTKAHTGDLEARFTLAQQSMDSKDYANATLQYDAILGLSYCDSACQSKGKGLDATAYYNLAEGQLKAKDYETAVVTFDDILQNFPDTPEAKKLHGDLAKALMGQGLAQRKSSCSSAIPTYQRLAKQFKDTGEGKKAQSDLNAPQTVKGKFSNTESYDYQQIGLTTGLKGGMGTDALFSKWDNAPYKVSIDGNGNFTFTGIRQGTYDLIWYSYSADATASYEHVEFMYNVSTNEPIYVAKVGPLCTVNMGTVTNSRYY